MKKLFTLAILISGMMAFSALYAQKVIRVEAGTDQLAAAYDQASSGDIIELVTSGGIYHETGKIKIKKPLTIRAAYGLDAKPVVESSSPDRPFEPRGGCTYFKLEGIKVTGFTDDGVTDAKDSTKYAIRTRSMDTTYTLICENVDFDYFVVDEGGVEEGYVMRQDDDANADDIEFINCTFSRVAKHALRFDGPTQAPGPFKSLSLKHCTFNQIDNRGISVTLLPDAGDTAAVRIDHCTFAGVGDDAMRITKGSDIEITNTIFYNVNDNIISADSTDEYTRAEIYYCDTLNTNGYSDYVVISDSMMYAEDPEFADPDNFDFTVSTFFKSNAVGNDDMVLGSLKWDPDSPVIGNGVIPVEPGTNVIADAYDLAKTYNANVIEMTTSGNYVQEDKIKVKKALLVRGANGLEEKPVLVAGTDARPFEPTSSCSFFGLDNFVFTGFVDDGVQDSKDSTKYAMRFRKNSVPVVIYLNNVDFDYFYSLDDDPPEGYIIRFEGTYAPELRVTNCTFTRVAKTVFRFDEPVQAPGQLGSLFVENCTFAEVGSRGIDLTLLNELDADTASVYVNHCTFAGIGSDALKVDNGMDLTVKNSIFYEVGDKIVDADSAEVYTNGSFSYNDTLYSSGFGDFLNLEMSDIYAEDPEFANPDSLDFTVSEFFAGIAVGDDGEVVGDLRWKYITAIDNDATLPEEFQLMQNYPNPFNPLTTIRYNLPKELAVKLTVYNVLGEKVVRLIDEKQSMGQHHVIWNGIDANGKKVSSGQYFFKIEAGDFVSVKKMTLIK